jgi:hypothetical protein
MRADWFLKKRFGLLVGYFRLYIHDVLKFSDYNYYYYSCYYYCYYNYSHYCYYYWVLLSQSN